MHKIKEIRKIRQRQQSCTDITCMKCLNMTYQITFSTGISAESLSLLFNLHFVLAFYLKLKLKL